MYTLISAIAKPVGLDARWASADIGNMALNTIFATYAQTYAILSNPYLDHEVSLNLDDIRGQYGGQNVTFNQFLVNIGSASLPTSDTLPVINTRYAKYADAFHAGYKIAPVSPTASPDAQLPDGAKTWLYLTRPNTDYDLFHKSCLVSINGFFHFIDADTNGVYVRDGNVSRVQSRQNQIGIYSFRELGQLTYVPITTAMVYKQIQSDVYKNRAFINLGQDVSNKTVMLVLGGYLHVLDNRTFFRTGDGEFCVDFQNLPLLDRYYESSKYLDLSSLITEHTSRNDTQIALSDLLSDRALLDYLTLSQSFFVILDNADVFVEKQGVHRTLMPGMFISYTPPEYPLVCGVGRIADYWYTEEDGQFSVTCVDSFRDNKVYWTTDPYAQNSIDASRVAYDPVRNSPAYFLKVGTDM